jgi:Bor protein
MIRLRLALVAALALLGSACFHQSVSTGQAPSSTVVEHQFVKTWLWGIIPADTIDVRQKCPSGVAKVETEQSFVNGLVGIVTLGIYSPQHLRVTCAA